MHSLRFRQVHLDFHTSPDISGIGEKFDKREWQERLREAHVDSITCFSVCHHGWNYHETRVGKMHPHLRFDLLRAQYEACREIDINVPIYISAGLNYRLSVEHPEWNEYSPEGKGPGPLNAGFIKLCFNSPYLDWLCRQVEEVVRLYPECNGIFLDIIRQGQCCCRHCMEGMAAAGLDPEKEEDRLEFANRTLIRYYEKTTAAARKYNPEMPVFHNSGHVSVGKSDILKKFFSHLELESLPTGGWGYDHYPLSAAYARSLGMDFLGMTGKFHTTWGEFGGFKHPNALRYECAAMLANNSKCSIGDQLHPNGRLDRSTYRLIGTAYAEVERKEEWCRNARSRANLALLSAASRTGARREPADIGAGRILLEGHIPFDLVDLEMDWSRYRFLLIPDSLRLKPEEAAKVEAFRRAGGKLILSGAAGMLEGEERFGIDVPFDDFGESEFSPDYLKPEPEFAPDYLDSPFVMYLPARRIRRRSGRSLGKIFDPYFNRNYRHFCSHRHTPNRPEPSGYDAGVCDETVLYFAHPVFSIYRGYGAVPLKEFILKAIRSFLGGELPVEVSLPSTGRVTLMEQPERKREIVHLLFANTVNRGGGEIPRAVGAAEDGWAIEVIEELLPLYDVEVRVRPGIPVRRVRLVPENVDLPFREVADSIAFTVPKLVCHQMVELS